LANCVILSGGTWSPDNWCKVKRSLGPYRLATSLEEAGYTTFVLDFIEEFTPAEASELLSKHIGPDTLWFGFSSSFFWNKQEKYTNANTSNDDLRSMYYTDYKDVKFIINLVRFMAPQAKILYGGSKSQFFAVYDVDKNIDYYVTGNADNSIIDITDTLAGKKQSIEHLSGKVIDSYKYPEPDIKNIPTKWWNYPVLKNEGLPIELARGCIFKCKFCDYTLTGKKKGTYLRDPEQIKDEMIKNWETHGTTSYYFTDDTFNDDNDKLESLYKVFQELPFDLKFSSFLRLDLINRFPHQAQLLRDMGLVGAFFGIESLNQKSATAVGKGMRTEKVKDKLYALRESDQWGNNVNIEAGFILGLPYDTREYFEELIQWCMLKDNPIDACRFSPLMLFHYKDNPELQRYASEFSLNPEIYGYKVNRVCKWELPEQNLDYMTCLEYSNKFNDIVSSKTKIAGFGVITSLNTGVSLEDIRNLPECEIQQKYNIPEMNRQRINEYKRLVK
jgi:hypothetical protein